MSDQQYLKLDTTLIKLCSQKIADKNETVLDGMSVSSLLVNNRDSNIISLIGSYEKENPISYHYIKSLIETCKSTFQDSLISEYFSDLEGYIDESKWHRADPKRRIDQLRMKKYNWSIIKD